MHPLHKKKSHNSCIYQNFFVSLQANCVTMSKKSVILLLTLLVISIPRVFAGSADTLHTTYVVKSDYVPTHVVTISAGGGLHALLPTLTQEGKDMIGLGKSVGAGAQLQATYTYYFHKYVGITAGLGFELYTGNMNGAFTDSVYLYDSHPNNQMYYWLYNKYIDFKEREQLYMLTIPVGITGRVNVTDPIQLRGTIGFGMNAIVGSHYKGQGQMEATGYYPDYELHFDPDLPQHGFSNYFMGGYSGSIANTFPVSMFIFGDFGMHYQFTRRYGLYAGIYISYTCFNAIRPTVDEVGNRPELVKYDMATRQWEYSGIINSKFVQALNPLSVGVKIGFTLTFLDPIKCNCENW